MRNATFRLAALIAMAAASCSEEVQAPMGPQDLTLAAPAQIFTSNFTQAFTDQVFVPCANGGNGELVELQVVWHFLSHLTINGNHFTASFLIHDAGTSGNGLVTGDLYRGTGATKTTFTASFRNGQFSDTFVNNVLFIGQGPGNNFRSIQTFHVTINANGEVTVTFNKPIVVCN